MADTPLFPSPETIALEEDDPLEVGEAGEVLQDDRPMIYHRIAVPLPVHGAFTWHHYRRLEPGVSVLVPFGRRQVTGWVIETVSQAEVANTKPILKVLDAEPAFDATQLSFFRWMADYYLSPLGEIIASAIPASAKARTRRIYRPTEAGISTLAEAVPPGDTGRVLREIVARPGLTRSALARRLHGEVEEAEKGLDRLLEQGLVEGEDLLLEAVKDEETWVVLTVEPSLSGLAERAVKARETLATLKEKGPQRLADLDSAAVKRLEQKGMVRKEQRKKSTEPLTAPPTAPSAKPVLNSEQVTAVAAVDGPGTWLLHGVTGAGKTEVYLHIAEHIIQQGKQVLVLVPEIALTPQLTGRFIARFGESVAVLHSGLSPAERRLQWRRIAQDEAKVAVGARSAIFAPFHRLGLVVVDEENDDSYKQDDGVRYHARDLAVVRGRIANCPVVLGSATPSLESWENARAGRYHLLSLTRRATPRPVPRLEVVDLKKEPRVHGKEVLVTGVVRQSITEALMSGGKAILLYNRRGYATFVECPGCGTAADCPSCGVAMVYHQRNGRLDCHYCGYHKPFQPTCDICGSTFAVLGRGTERVEETVAELFPGVSISRMDADTTSERGSHARILDDFREGRTQLLVGTQLVAKGHDFPDVHVAAVLGADHILGMPDFRSAERAFALVTQLIGRAGRGDIPGRVFLQTHHPDHPVFGSIGDMKGFAEHEMHVRRTLGYPPFTRLVMLRLEGEDRASTQLAMEGLARQIREQASRYPGVDLLGPTLAPLSRLVGRWRFQLILRGWKSATFRHFLRENHTSWKVPTGVRKIMDVDPRDLL